MEEFWRKPVTRRTVLQSAAAVGLGAAAAACAPPGASTGSSGGGGKKQLRILQWSHFVPQYDKWIDQYVADWGQKNGVDATIDHINTDDLPARMAAEVAAKGGHDLVEMNGQILTYLYEKQFEDMSDIVDYAVKKWGAVEPLGEKLCKVNGKWVAAPNYYIAITPQIRADLITKYGYNWKDPSLNSWDKWLEIGTKAKADNHSAGLPISHCNDANHNWRAVMWAFGASEVAEDGKTITVDTKQMRDFLSYTQEFYVKANNPDVFAWDNTGDNKWLDSGVGFFIHDALSSMRSLQGQNDALYNNIQMLGPVAGAAHPKGISMPDANVYVIWNFAPQQNKDLAKQFLKSFYDDYATSFDKSLLYNQPFFANRYNTPLFTSENGKYAVLQNYRGDVVQTFGYPGPPNYAANLVLANFVIPDMVQTAVKQQGSAGVEAAIAFAKPLLTRYYAG